MRKLNIFLLTAIFVFGLSCVSLAANQIKIFVNDKEVNSDVPPQMINGRIMVPIRVVSESLGAEVKWDETTQSVHIDYTSGTSFNQDDITEYNNWAASAIQLFEEADKAVSLLENTDDPEEALSLLKTVSSKLENLIDTSKKVYPPREDSQNFNLFLIGLTTLKSGTDLVISAIGEYQNGNYEAADALADESSKLLNKAIDYFDQISDSF